MENYQKSYLTIDNFIDKCDKECIGISNDRMNHILSVARQCYTLAKNKYNLTEDESEKMFLIGFLHDIGIGKLYK